MIRCTENVQPPIKRYEHCNNTRNLSLCIKGSTVQVSNYTDCSRIYIAQPLLRSHKNLLTKTTSRFHQTGWQSVNKTNRRITRCSSTENISGEYDASCLNCRSTQQHYMVICSTIGDGLVGTFRAFTSFAGGSNLCSSDLRFWIARSSFELLQDLLHCSTSYTNANSSWLLDHCFKLHRNKHIMMNITGSVFILFQQQI